MSRRNKIATGIAVIGVVIAATRSPVEGALVLIIAAMFAE